MIHGALSGRTAIVTGAGCAAGAAAACALSRAGASVVLAARAGPALDALAAELGSAVAVPTDLTNPVSVRRLVEQTLGAFGRLDAAFNGTAVSLAMRYQIPPMRQAGRGRIVNLAPTAAVLSLTRDAAVAVAGSGVQINAITTGAPTDVARAVAWLCSNNR
jgi:short-subunit dehydrogenase involved in D-alanine esterification of teichoic acids